MTEKQIIKNCLSKWQAKLGYRFARKFAKDAGVSYGSYNQWYKNDVEITLSSLITVYKFIKSKLPDNEKEKFHIEDLLILKDEK